MSTQPDNEFSDELEETLRQQREEQTYSDRLYNTIATLFYPLYKKIFSGRGQLVTNLSRKLEKAGTSEPVEVYISAYLGMGVLSGATIGLTLCMFLWDSYKNIFVNQQWFNVSAEFLSQDWIITTLLANTTRLASVIIGGGVILSIAISIAAATSVYIGIKIQDNKITKRQEEIDALLPDAIAFMYCLSTSNMSRINIVRELASSEEIYSEVSVEFQRVVHRIDMYSADYHTALSDVSEITPSDDLSTFLNDMLSTISSGGDIESFLETQLDLYMSDVKRSQEQELDSLELFNEGYITISLVPVVGLTVVGFATVLPFPSEPLKNILMLISYFGVSVIQVGSLLFITSIFQNDHGGGTLEQDEGDNFTFYDDDESDILSAGIADRYKGQGRLFDQIYANEIRTRIFEFLKDPFVYVRKKPEYTFTITIPTAAVFILLAIVTGQVNLSIDYMIENGFKSTLLLFYAPLMISVAPYVYFYEIDLYKRGSILDGLTEDLNKLANTNEKGITLQESLLLTAQDRDTKLAKEFKTMYKKHRLKIPLGKSIIEMNNRYRIPRLARIFRIIKSAQDVSDNITPVLNTASDLAESQHNIIQDRKSRTREQVGVVALIFVVFLISLILMNGVMAPTAITSSGGSAASGATSASAGSGALGISGFNSVFGGGSDPPLEYIETVTFHGALIQALIAGVISGYIQTGKYKPGIKYTIIYSTLAMIAWLMIPTVQSVAG